MCKNRLLTTTLRQSDSKPVPNDYHLSVLCVNCASGFFFFFFFVHESVLTFPFFYQRLGVVGGGFFFLLEGLAGALQRSSYILDVY